MFKFLDQSKTSREKALSAGSLLLLQSGQSVGPS